MEVDMDVSGLHHHQQELSSQTLESMLQVCTKPQDDKKPRPPEEAMKCPRCDSSNTKFCYYNNYSLTQPRYFCKSCRRYWTKGGTLRNVPVGGGCRKNNKRNSSSSSSVGNSSNSSPCSAPSKMRSGPQQHPLNFFTPSSSNNINLLAGVPQLAYDSTSTDLSLAFARLQRQQNGSIGYDQFDHVDHHLGANIGDQLGFLGFLDNTSNMVYNGGNNNNNNNNNNTNIGDMGLNINVGGNHDQDQYQMLNHPMFHDDHQEHVAVKQEACNMMSSFDHVGSMGYQGNMVHEVESAGRSMIGGWINGIGATNRHGLINSPLM
ncbi:uncharacterized protein LOC143637671 [Bidens hawaiensis]|uniref:uncharacterized protein LOC143637671 n=1 Tax=Bidens hawaiensis TaxID=980011 RepID=UPI00404A5213